MDDPDTVITIRLHGFDFTFRNGIWSTKETGASIPSALDSLGYFTDPPGRHDLALNCVKKVLKARGDGEDCIVEVKQGEIYDDWGKGVPAGDGKPGA